MLCILFILLFIGFRFSVLFVGKFFVEESLVLLLLRILSRLLFELSLILLLKLFFISRLLLIILLSVVLLLFWNLFFELSFLCLRSASFLISSSLLILLMSEFLLNSIFKFLLIFLLLSPIIILLSLPCIFISLVSLPPFFNVSFSKSTAPPSSKVTSKLATIVFNPSLFFNPFLEIFFSVFDSNSISEIFALLVTTLVSVGGTACE